MHACDIMTRNVITMKPTTKVLDAMDILVDNKISGAPVIDDNGAVLGVVTERDLLVSVRFLRMQPSRELHVQQFMTKNVITFPEDIPVENLIQVMLCQNIKRIPIVTDNRVVGIVSRRDILKSMHSPDTAEPQGDTQD